MEIIKEIGTNELTLKIKGRLDTTSSSMLDAETKTIDESVTTLILDFAELDYVSSSGLRIILSLQKTMSKRGKLIIRNVSSTINEIFEITGFSNILTIE